MSQGQGNITFSGPSTNNGSGGSGSGTLTGITEGQGIKVTPSATSPTVANRLNWYFVDQYGAKGDGVTDDTAAIQACIAAASANPYSVVYFPPLVAAKYILSGKLTASNPITLMGATSGYGDGIKLQWDADADGIELSGNGSAIIGLTIANTFASPASAIGLEFTGFNLLLDNCSFQGWYDQVVVTENDASIIQNCAFSGFANFGLYLTNTDPDEGDATIVSCLFFGTKSANACFAQDGSGGTKFVNCKFLGQDFVDYCIYMNISGSGTTDLFVSNCSLENFNTEGISVNVIGASTFRQVSIVGGNISSYNGGVGIALTNGGGTMNSINIVGVCLDDNATAITIDGTAAEITGVNLVANSYTGTYVTRTGTTQVNFALAGDDNAAAPAAAAAAPAAQVYGSNAATLTTPAAWTEVVVNGTNYKIPLYTP